ncbi:MAG: DinB family protein [Phycisphaerae bacterium]
MPRPAADPVREQLLALIDAAFDHVSWHGPNLRGAIRRVDARQAAWRPAPRRHSIAEIVLHAAYWKYAAWRRLTGQPRGSFSLPGSNWFEQPEPFSAGDWQRWVKLLLEQHARLRGAVAAFSRRRLSDVPAGARVTNAALIRGVAFHDVYHAGQIQLLKRAYAARR